MVISLNYVISYVISPGFPPVAGGVAAAQLQAAAASAAASSSADSDAPQKLPTSSLQVRQSRNSLNVILVQVVSADCHRRPAQPRAA